MKSLRQICTAAFLTLALTIAVYAGQIQCPAAVPPPPPTGGDATATVIMMVVGVIYR